MLKNSPYKKIIPPLIILCIGLIVFINRISILNALNHTFLQIINYDVIKISDRTYPLNKTTKYRLNLNVAWDDDDYEVFPADIFYVLTPVGNLESERTASDFVAGRKVGKTAVPLEPFIGKTVVVEGNHYYDEPILLKPVAGEARGYVEQQVVANIKSIELVN